MCTPYVVCDLKNFIFEGTPVVKSSQRYIVYPENTLEVKHLCI